MLAGDWMHIPTAKNLKHARRSAARLRAAAACTPCKLIKQKCDDRRPCSRCKRNGRAVKCDSVPEEGSSNSTVIERPVRPNLHQLSLEGESKFLSEPLKIRYDWSRKTVLRYWGSGYDGERVASVFNTLPTSLASVMDQVFRSLNDIPDSEPSDPISFGINLPGACPQIPDASFWDSEEVYGCLEITFDPLTGQRQSIYMNPRYATIFGFHQEELLARFARHDADVQCCDVDLLLLLVDGVQHALDDRQSSALERYYRIYSGPDKTPVLVWTLWAKSLTRRGNFIKGSMIIKAISEEDYDAAVRRLPRSCPLHVAGDHRSGRELLESLDVDRRRMVNELARDAWSAALLARIIAFLRGHLSSFSASPITIANTPTSASSPSPTPLPPPAPAYRFPQLTAPPPPADAAPASPLLCADIFPAAAAAAAAAVAARGWGQRSPVEPLRSCGGL